MTSKPQRRLFLGLATTAFISAGLIVWFVFTLHGAISLLAFTAPAALLGYVWAAWLSKPAAVLAVVPALPDSADAVPVVMSPAPLPMLSSTGWPDRQPTLSTTAWA